MGISSRYAVREVHPLIDVTVTTLGAGKTHTTTSTGNLKADSQGVSQTTQLGATLSYSGTTKQTTQSGGIGSIDTLQLSGTYGDLTDLWVIPPVDSGGNPVDCEIRPVVDGVPFREHFAVTAGVNDNWFPFPGKSVGMLHLPIGIAYRKALAAQMKNLPLKATGWKYASRLQFEVFSNMGWGNTAAPVTPLRIFGTGDKMNAPALSDLNALLQRLIAAGYDPFSFTDQVTGFDPFNGSCAWPGHQILPSTWTSGPNGPAQVGVGDQVYRFARQAYNAIATGTTDPFYLSDTDATGGTSDNVANSWNSLGWDYTNSKKYLRLDLFGHRAGSNEAFVGVKVDDTVLPTTKGMPATSGVNLNPVGNVQGLRADSDLYYTLQASPFPVAVYQSKVVFFITANGTAIPAQLSATPTLQDASQVDVAGIEVIPA